MERGYIRLWRKCLDSGLLRSGPAWQLFGYLMLKTTHRPLKILVPGAVIDLEPGQVVFGRQKAARDLDLSEQTVRTALRMLEKLHIVSLRPTSKCTVVTFINWQIYQQEYVAPAHSANQPFTRAQPAPNPRSTTNKNKRTQEQITSVDRAPCEADASTAQPACTVFSQASSPDRAEPAVAGINAVAPAVPEPVAAHIPLVNGTEWGVPASFASELAAAYPGVDVHVELSRCRAWCLANPRQRKTPNGVRRFVNAWFARAQDRSRPAPAFAASHFSSQPYAQTTGSVPREVSLAYPPQPEPPIPSPAELHARQLAQQTALPLRRQQVMTLIAGEVGAA